MNREETEAAIEVMQAYVDGADLEYRYRKNPKWVVPVWLSFSTVIGWEFDCLEYRIKPKPKECWVRFRKDGSIQHACVGGDKQCAIEDGFIRMVQADE